MILEPLAPYRAELTVVLQLIADRIGRDTVLKSLEVATEHFTGYIGGCDPGYACAYCNTLSWSSETEPLPMEINPRKRVRANVRQARHSGTAAFDQPRKICAPAVARVLFHNTTVI